MVMFSASGSAPPPKRIYPTNPNRVPKYIEQGPSIFPFWRQVARVEAALPICGSMRVMSKALHEISRVMGLPGKPKGIDGAEVERYFHEGRIREIAEYCETVTYQVWLRYELFRGTLSKTAFEASQRNLRDFINRR
jgi:hypothetical protein